MPEIFTNRVDISGEVVELFSAASVVHRIVYRMLDDEPGTPFVMHLKGTSVDNKQFDRKTVDELRNVMEANRAEVSTIHSIVFADSSDHYPAVMYFIWPTEISISVTGTSRIALDRIAHHLLEELRESRALAAAQPGGEFVVREQTVSSHEDPPTAPTAPPAMPEPVSEPQPGWWKRTWREHTALLVVTIVGGVAVLVIGAKLLGIGG
ncbi:hypothetical protein ITJ57_08945 [Plantibacter sp. VKM Ac-2880]|uniref:hypothetical protein n=1 Tax=Plantibacter sp. VKM Ac-2880 TaxID=2783827 RepID=UPI00188FD2B4|nr:hypothetical protein [Plantibacter sp. VKM Ac-2880]MBF4568895.1 hypothetical protein [Plantibacter sp. VKM Ac-2880]